MIKKNFINYGITSRSIQERYGTKREMPYNYEIIQEIKDISEVSDTTSDIYRTEDKSEVECSNESNNEADSENGESRK